MIGGESSRVLEASLKLGGSPEAILVALIAEETKKKISAEYQHRCIFY
jgi:hypothetical protein